MFVQVVSTTADPGYEVRYLFEDFSEYEWGMPDELWGLCGRSDGIDAKRVTVEMMEVTYLLQGLALDDVQLTFDGYDESVVKTKAVNGDIYGYSVGAQVTNEKYFREDGSPRDARYDWKQKRELAIRDRRPAHGELPAIEICYRLRAPVPLRTLKAENPLAGIGMTYRELEERKGPVASWNPAAAWTDTVAALEDQFIGNS